MLVDLYTTKFSVFNSKSRAERCKMGGAAAAGGRAEAGAMVAEMHFNLFAGIADRPFVMFGRFVLMRHEPYFLAYSDAWTGHVECALTAPCSPHEINIAHAREALCIISGGR